MFWNGLYYNINIDLYVYLYDDMQWLCCRHWWVYFRDPRLWSTVYLHQHRRVVSLPPKGDVLHRIHSGCCRQLHGSVWTFFIDYKSEEFCSLLRLFSLDINECVANDSPCHAGHTCINTRGSYICRRNIVYCGRGYHLRENGTHCEGQCWSKRVEISGVLCLRCPSSSHSS